MPFRGIEQFLFITPGCIEQCFHALRQQLPDFRRVPQRCGELFDADRNIGARIFHVLWRAVMLKLEQLVELLPGLRRLVCRRWRDNARQVRYRGVQVMRGARR